MIYTIRDLQNAVVCPDAINDYYRNRAPEKWLVNCTDEYTGPNSKCPLNLANEQWRQCSGRYSAYAASNYGRIRKNGKKSH